MKLTPGRIAVLVAELPSAAAAGDLSVSIGSDEPMRSGFGRPQLVSGLYEE